MKYIFEKLLNEIKLIKERNNLEIVDTHVHPLDVMGIVHYDSLLNEIEQDKFKSFKNYEFYLEANILERLKFSKIAYIITRYFSGLFERGIQEEIKKLYAFVSKEKIVVEMKESLVDKLVFLPIEPWTSAKIINKYYEDKTFYTLGSVDIHHIKEEEIEENILGQIKDYKIIGVKLHPNLQNFKPQPSNNLPSIRDKLKKIYQIAEKNNLYLLFHGGLSFYTKNIDPRYNQTRDKKNALLSNFCDKDGKSEIFGQYNIPIVIAHMGHYGAVSINYKLIEIITKKYNNVFFDTAGVSPYILRKIIQIIGSKKILFGSDALYNRIVYSLLFLYLAVKDARINESFEEALINILGKNFEIKILKD